MMTDAMRASSTVPDRMPGIPTVQLSGRTPALERRPAVGLNPTTPHSAAGIRTEPGTNCSVVAVSVIS